MATEEVGRRAGGRRFERRVMVVRWVVQAVEIGLQGEEAEVGRTTRRGREGMRGRRRARVATERHRRGQGRRLERR